MMHVLVSRTTILILVTMITCIQTIEGYSSTQPQSPTPSYTNHHSYGTHRTASDLVAAKHTRKTSIIVTAVMSVVCAGWGVASLFACPHQSCSDTQKDIAHILSVLSFGAAAGTAIATVIHAARPSPARAITVLV